MGSEVRIFFSHQLSNRSTLGEHKSEIIRVHLSSRVVTGREVRKKFSHQLSNRSALGEHKSEIIRVHLRSRVVTGGDVRNKSKIIRVRKIIRVH